MKDLYILKSTKEIVQIADFVNSNTVKVYIVESAIFDRNGTKKQPVFKDVSLNDLIKL